MSSNDKKKPGFLTAKINGENYPLPNLTPLRTFTGLDLPIPGDIRDMISFLTGMQPGRPTMRPLGIEVIELKAPPQEFDLDGQDPETINSPSHYRAESGIEAIDVIEAWDLDFNLGNVVKYICRDGLKDTGDAPLENLQKALWYLQREIDNRKAKIR